MTDRSSNPGIVHIRRAGRLPLGDAILAWSMAEGTRGRRWRSNLLRDGQLVQVLMLEISTPGRPTRLELSTTSGLLTLHPEPDESMIHGNVVRDSRVEPLALPWSPDHELVIAENPIPVLVALHRRVPHGRVGEEVAVLRWPVISIDSGLVARAAEVVLRGGVTAGWTVSPAITSADVDREMKRLAEQDAGTGEGRRELRISPDGLPVAEGAEEWPLEIE